MTAWWNLLVKELKLGRKLLYGGLIFAILIAAVGVGFAVYYPYGIASIAFFAGSSMIVFYLLVYLIVSFSNERNSYSTWMQIPLPGWSLIAAKFVAGLLSMLVTMAAVILLMQAVMAFDGSPDLSEFLNNEAFGLTESDKADLRMGEEIIRYMNEHYFELMLVAVPILLGGAALLGAAYLVFYFTRKTLQRWIGGWSTLIGVAAVIAVLRIYDIIFQSPIIKLFDWGTLPISETSIAIGGDTIDVLLETMSIGHLLFDYILVGLVVFACGWLLDRKVEVR